MRIRLPRIIGALLVAGLTLGFAGPAFAQTTTTDGTDTATRIDVENAKDRCVQAVDRRLDTLAKAQARLDEVDFVTESHVATLESIIGRTDSGLRSLKDGIINSEDPREVRKLCLTIAPGYRVYLVVVPQVRLTAAADRISSADERIAALTARFDEAVARAKEAGADVSEAVALRDRAVEQFATAMSGVEGVADSVLAVTPAGFNEGPGAVTLDNARAAIRTSAEQMRSGWETGKAAVQALKDAIAAV